MSDIGNPRNEEEGRGRRPVKVTDKRRVRPEEEAGAPADPSGEQSLTDAGTAPAGGSEAELEAAQRWAEECRHHLQRLKAEFDNYRKRVLKEQTRAVEMASEPLIRRLLEVLDEFDLALIAAERTPDFERFLHGVELVYAKLIDSLRAEGLERIDAAGRPFHPKLHEALLQSGEGDAEPVVADVFRQGYLLRGRVLRPAGVKVVRK